MIYFSFHSLIHPCVSSSSFPPAHSTPEHTYHPSLPLTKQCNRKMSSTCVFFNIKKREKANKNLLPQAYKNNSIQRLWNNRERTFSWRQILAWVCLTRINEHQQVEFCFNFFNHRLELVFFPGLIQNLSQIHENLWTISWESVDICEK